MILLLGGNGYVGTAFKRYFERRSIPYRNLSRGTTNYASADVLRQLIRETKPTFLINAAGYTGKPNVDACEIFKTECVMGNVVLPGVIKTVCNDLTLPWGHVSSGCIYSGNTPDGKGFTEEDTPNFSFRTNNCSFYSGCKALGEECLKDAQNAYIWRLRIPFNNIDSSRNYISKVLRYTKLLEATNSISHLDEFVQACFATHEKNVPYGIYNITNPGPITTREVVEMAQRILRIDRNFAYFADESEFMKVAAKTPRSNCVLDCTKLLSHGIALRDAKDAIHDSLSNWIPETT